MDQYTSNLIEAARSTYKDVVTGTNSRITRGNVLWDLFEGAARACAADAKSGERQLAERINELAVAKILADDEGLQSAITYEPDLLPDGRKIDFVADRGRDDAYIEVKTVHPDIADTEAAWRITLSGRSFTRKMRTLWSRKIGWAENYMETPSPRARAFSNTRWILSHGWPRPKKYGQGLGYSCFVETGCAGIVLI